MNWIPGYENIYSITKSGSIFSHKSGKGTRLNGPRQVKPSVDRNGYERVRLYGNGDRTWDDIYLHQLMARTFLNEHPEKREVDHIDGDSQNNSLENLRWVSKQENMNYFASRTRRKWGAVKKRDKWEARIQVNSKVQILGYFKDKDVAHDCYYNKHIEIHGFPPWEV